MLLGGGQYGPCFLFFIVGWACIFCYFQKRFLLFLDVRSKFPIPFHFFSNVFKASDMNNLSLGVEK